VTLKLKVDKFWKVAFFLSLFLFLATLFSFLRYRINYPLISHDIKIVNENIALPVVQFVPGGLFTKLEKSEIDRKIIGPLVDYENDKEIRIVAVLITKLTNKSNSPYEYDFQALYKDGVYHGFVFNKEPDGTFKFQRPNCRECEFSDAYKRKYPEIVKNY